LYASPNIVRAIKWRTGGLCSTHADEEVYKILVGKPEGKRPLGRPMRRWEDNIRKDLREIGWQCVNSSGSR
jgi:hypothetical protein